MNPAPFSAADVVFGRRDWRQQLQTDYGPTAQRLQDAYTRILPRLREAADNFNTRAAEIVAGLQDGTLTVQTVRGMTEYQQLLARVEVELQDFATIARDAASGVVDSAVVTGEAAALDMALATSGSLASAVSGAWNRVDPEALVRLIGYLDSPAMQTNFRAFGANAAQNLSDLILSGVAQGRGPTATARMMSAWLNVPYAWADNMTRTVQLWSYRNAAQTAYAANSDVVTGWVWVSARDERTCISCWSKHGSIHPVDEIMNDHHRGRCDPVPIVKGTDWINSYPSGEDLFNNLTPAQQRNIMGNAMYNAWSAGEVSFGDMSRPYQDDVYGTMLRAASVKELLGKRASQFYG